METSSKKSNNNIFKRLGLVGFGLCVLCCTLPIIGTVLGVGVLSVIASQLEKVAMILMIATAVFFGIWFIRKKTSAPSCDIDCNSNPNKKK